MIQELKKENTQIKEIPLPRRLTFSSGEENAQDLNWWAVQNHHFLHATFHLNLSWGKPTKLLKNIPNCINNVMVVCGFEVTEIPADLCPIQLVGPIIQKRVSVGTLDNIMHVEA